MTSDTSPVIAIFMLLLIAFPVLLEASVCFFACCREIGSDMIRWQLIGAGAPGCGVWSLGLWFSFLRFCCGAGPCRTRSISIYISSEVRRSKGLNRIDWRLCSKKGQLISLSRGSDDNFRVAADAGPTQILIRSYDEHRRAHTARAIRDDPDTSLATSSPEPQMPEARVDS